MTYDVLRLFGYEQIINNNVRHFYLSFHSNEILEVKMSDGMNNKFNSYAFEVYLKQLGTPIFENKKHEVFLIYDSVWYIVLLVIF